MKLKLSCLSFILLLAFSVRAQEISTTLLKKYIGYLADDKMKGRGTSSPEEKKSAVYIAGIFEKCGLKPAGEQKSMFYEFSFKKNLSPHDTSTSNVVERKGMDVIGFLDNGAEYTIVIGAHYDHLGLGGDHNSLDPNPEGKIHNGADDNASGTAGVMELARYYSSNKIKEKYNFLFMCFSGEELGLLGSKKWCDNPTYPLEKINYMINMDMIGRLNDSTKKLIIYGVGTAPDFVPLIDNLKSEFSVKKDSAGIGPSDQTSFYLKDIPVLHFFTGQHSDYHKPSDDANKVNYEGEKKVLEYIIRLEQETEKLPKLKFTATKSKETTSAKWKVSMGVMPDYTFEGKGMRVDGVTDGKPASKAGVKKGDVVIKLGNVNVENMDSYMKALSELNKGDKTKVKVMRNGKEEEFPIEF
ncbi:MAG: M20/M25/M40 family metallo-hydrolase [Bacteroidia bacterium]